MDGCIFCKIIAGDIPSPRYYEDDDMIVIKDAEPRAKQHYLAIPKEHYATLAELDDEKAETLKRIVRKIPALRDKLGCENGYRLVVNQGADAGQTVPHLHIHILGGEKLSDL